MRAGGESDKLANQYEGCWTIYNLLGLLRSEYTELLVEPLQEGLGIEFIKVFRDGTREFHSAKIQTTKDVWTVPMLCAEKETGRSILGDLFKKLADPKARVRFVSETGANALALICKDAGASENFMAFQSRLSKERNADLQDYILPKCGGDEARAFDYLKRAHVVGFTFQELTEVVEREISRELYRPDGQPVDPAAVRRLLCEIVLGSLGKALTRDVLVQRLEEEGVCEANWSRDRSILDRVRARNESYLRSVRGQLINGANIHRQESEDALKVILTESDRFGAFVGVAGLGKSCTAAELLDLLGDSGVPHIALRLDDQFEALTPRQLGLSIDLPASPVDVLAGIAEGGLCVLLLDHAHSQR